MPPAGQSNKRVKGKRITRLIIIGSEAWPLTPENRPAGIPDDHTTGWKIYVRGMEGGPDINVWLKKVQFKLFHTYANPLRTVETAPFEVQESGWGGFQVDIRLHFQPVTAEKPQWRSHFLQLEPYGTEEERQKQISQGRVISEYVEAVEFNEPHESLWDAFTSANQWNNIITSRITTSALEDQRRITATGKGSDSLITVQKGSLNSPKGHIRSTKHSRTRSSSSSSEADSGNETGGLTGSENDDQVTLVRGTCELPAKSTPTNPYSQEMEDNLVSIITAAEKQVMEQLGVARERYQKVEERIAELKASGDFLPRWKKKV